RTPAGENTVATVGSAGAPPRPVTHAPAAKRPGRASMLSAGRARWSANTANDPSKPASVQCGGVRAPASWPSVITSVPSASDTVAGPTECGPTERAPAECGPAECAPAP